MITFLTNRQDAKSAKKGMKIAFVVSEFPALSETFILNQIVGLRKHGYEVDIYAEKQRNEPKIHPDVEKYDLLSHTYYAEKMPQSRFGRLLKSIGLILTNFPKAPKLMLRVLNIFKYGKKYGSLTLLYEVIPWLRWGLSYDIIHCHFGTNGLKGALLQDVGAIQGKLITTFHGMDVNVVPRQYGVDVYKQLFLQGDLYTVNTEFTRQQVIALGCPEDKIFKLPVGFQISQYSFCDRKLNSGEAVKIITVARLVEKKGIEYAIKAIAEIAKDYPNIIYRIVGDGSLRESLECLVLDLKISDNVKLLGWMTQEQVRQLYDDSHIFILPSVTAADGDREGQALVLQEAQAMGLPILSTLHNGIPEGVLDGESGFLVPERDVEALAKKLRYLVTNPEVWAKMGRQGRAYVEERYNIEQLNQQLVEIYQKLMN